jgi:hypothetical protein
MKHLAPIFIHSLFRAGSTYVFNCFRRSTQQYWCYQEPLNEFLLNSSSPAMLLQPPQENIKYLRHPELERPYFYEFHELAEQIEKKYRPEFPYENYFSNEIEATDLLNKYLKLLIDEAKGRPVLQECRTCGRVEVIKKCLKGKHIFLWRNPWDQWWSYKIDSYFDICNLQILSASSAPPLFIELRQMLNFCPVNSDVENLQGQRLDADNSYMLFFVLWCHSMLEARPKCDYEINIDSLSLDKSYRDSVITRLEAGSITRIDFSDCSVPMGIYGPEDRAFFQEIEEQVYELFALHGYSADAIAEMVDLRKQYDCHQAKPSTIDLAIVKELDKSHKTARRLETELSISQRQLSGIKETVRKQEQDLQDKDLQLQELSMQLQELSKLKTHYLYPAYKLSMDLQEYFKKLLYRIHK